MTRKDYDRAAQYVREMQDAKPQDPGQDAAFGLGPLGRTERGSLVRYVVVLALAFAGCIRVTPFVTEKGEAAYVITGGHGREIEVRAHARTRASILCKGNFHVIDCEDNFQTITVVCGTGPSITYCPGDNDSGCGFLRICNNNSNVQNNVQNSGN